MAIEFDDFPTTPNTGPSLTLGTQLNNKFNLLKNGLNGFIANTWKTKGAYNAATAYVVNDVVSLSGVYYINLVPCTGVAPNADPTKWAKIGGSVSWTDITGKPATFAPSAHSHIVGDVTGLQGALDLKAPLASPALTGTPTAPTAALGTNTTQIATTAHVKASIDALVAGAPGALDTLNEIATQLAADESAASALLSTVSAHNSNTANPHAVTKAQVGLGSVDNTSDLAKPVSTAQATALDVYGAATSGNFAVVTSRLKANNEDVVIQIFSDSTGVSNSGQTRWPLLVSQWLATQYPAYTVKLYAWNDTNQSYDAAQTLGTGTGARTLSVYNGAVSGTDYTYPTGTSTRFATMVPVAPHLTIINYGHNQGNLVGSGYRPLYYSLIRLILDFYPQTAMVCTAQNLRVNTDANYSADVSRKQAVIDLCATEGYGLINVMQAFLNDPNYANNLLLPDGLHPNDSAGSPLWASIIQNHLRASVYVTPRAQPQRMIRHFIPAESFILESGMPALGVNGASDKPFPAWTLADAFTQGVLCQAWWPLWWQTVNIYAVWAPVTGSGYTGANNVVQFELSYSQGSGTFIKFNSPSAGTSTSAPATIITATTNASATNAGAYATHYARLASGLSLVSRPVTLRLRRNGAAGADTLAENALFRGLLIERAS